MVIPARADNRFITRRYTLAEYLDISLYLEGLYTLIKTTKMYVITYIAPGLQYVALFVMLAYIIVAMSALHPV